MKRWTEYIIEAKQKYKTGYLTLGLQICCNRELPYLIMQIYYFEQPPHCIVRQCGITWLCSFIDKIGGANCKVSNNGEHIAGIEMDNLTANIYNFPAPWDSLVDLGQIIKRDAWVGDNGWTGLYCKDNLIHIEEPSNPSK